jgi:hypothetical protein
MDCLVFEVICPVFQLIAVENQSSYNRLIVKLQVKHLVNTRSPQNLSGTATNPLYNWPDIAESN